MIQLKNKVAIITGGASGIGKATANLFLKQGAKVMIVDKNRKEIKELKNEFKTANLAFCIADVSKTEDTKYYVSETLLKFGGIDIFFNNAGIEGVSKPIPEYPEDVFDSVIAVNLKGVWLGCQYVIPKMNSGGSVIITSSVAGLKGFTGLGAYVASKHGVVGIMKTAAIEFAPKKIRINSIHPGPINNRMMRSIEKDISPGNPMEAQKAFEAAVPFGRYGESQEVAAMVLYLASDESRYVTGATFVIDGGMITA